MTGIDISDKSISFARQFENDSLHFFVHDMRKPFITNYFDLALNLFTSFGYFKSGHENELSIRTMFMALKKNGILVMDFFNAGLVQKTLVELEEKTIEGTSFILNKRLDDKFPRATGL